MDNFVSVDGHMDAGGGGGEVNGYGGGHAAALRPRDAAGQPKERKGNPHCPPAGASKPTPHARTGTQDKVQVASTTPPPRPGANRQTERRPRPCSSKALLAETKGMEGGTPHPRIGVIDGTDASRGIMERNPEKFLARKRTTGSLRSRKKKRQGLRES